MTQDRTMIDRLEEQTGRTLAQWKKVLAAAGLEKHGQMVSLLKNEHGVTHGYANLIVHEFRAGGTEADDDPVAVQYAGKESLRPVYDRILEAVEAFGNDVEVAPKKSYVSLRRSKQFALVQPSTKTRVDLGLKLSDAEPAGRLEAAGSWNAMVTHRVRLTRPAEVDETVVGWLRAAYDQA